MCVCCQGCAAADKEATLLALAASSYGNGRTIVFFRTKVATHRAKLLFGLAELPAAAELHGNMSQTGRLEALDAFRKVLLLSCCVTKAGASPRPGPGLRFRRPATADPLHSCSAAICNLQSATKAGNAGCSSCRLLICGRFSAGDAPPKSFKH